MTDALPSQMLILIVSLIAHGLLLFVVLFRRLHTPTTRSIRSGRIWLVLMVILSAGAAALALTTYPSDAVLDGVFNRPLLITLTLAAVLVTYGALVIQDTGVRVIAAWMIGGLAWIGVMIAMPILRVSPDQPIAIILTFGGFALAGLMLVILAFYAFYRAGLPEIANRDLFWVLDTAVLLMGAVFTLSGSPLLSVVGVITLTLGTAGAVYAHTSYRIFDIRREVAAGLRRSLILVVTAAFLFASMILAQGLDFTLTIESVVAVTALAVALSLIYLPFRSIFARILDALFEPSLVSVSDATRRYSQQISGALELDALVELSTRTLNSVMRVRRSALILVNDKGAGEGVVEFQIASAPPMIRKNGQEFGAARRMFPKNGLIYQMFDAKRQPISQFDLEYNPVFQTLPDTERQFFREMGMSAYAPIIADNRLIGVLACGAKRSDAPFYPRDLELLATLANQTGAALRNARMVTDLRQLNRDMQSLNQGLSTTHEQMERLDSVKTDFVTIASHELRTPLAQIRGYTDILDTLNDQEALEQAQTAGLVSNLRKAAERMEELITAMLDVSQIDVNALDLRFAQTSLESVVRMAIEPLSDAVRQRKLYLSSRGLRGLPPIQADLQRLVQAFRNVIVNAIKFTPDGGRIDISASVQPAPQLGGIDHLLIKITDSGVGIDKENLDLIFRKFYRAYDPSLHSTGTYKFMGAGPGLGLTIAKGVIEGHGGAIWAESSGYDPANFSGSTFYISIPVTPPKDARRVKPFETQESSSVSAAMESSPTGSSSAW